MPLAWRWGCSCWSSSKTCLRVSDREGQAAKGAVCGSAVEGEIGSSHQPMEEEEIQAEERKIKNAYAESRKQIFMAKER